eukprot:COSAG06_NODE_29039_length_563_cov_1.185345_1_plen_30_part_10
MSRSSSGGGGSSGSVAWHCMVLDAERLGLP